MREDGFVGGRGRDARLLRTASALISMLAFEAIAVATAMPAVAAALDAARQRDIETRSRELERQRRQLTEDLKVRQFDEMNKLKEQLDAVLTKLAKDKRIRILGINYKDQADNARRFLGRYGNPYASVGADTNGRASIDWGVYGVPETFVVDGRATRWVRERGRSRRARSGRGPRRPRGT